MILTAAGFAALLAGLFVPHLGTKGVLLFMGVGTLLIFIGVSMLSVRFIVPLAGAVGPPARWLLTALWLLFLFLTPIGWVYQIYHRVRYGAWPTYIDRSSADALARDNARRNPQRTASTAAALMIGLALVTLVAMLAAGIVSSFRGAVNSIWNNADYAITAQNNFTPLPVAAADTAASSPVVAAIANVRTGQAEAFGSTFQATAVNPPGATIFQLNWQNGSNAIIARLGENGAFIDNGYATEHKLKIGSPVQITFASGVRKAFVIRASSILPQEAPRSGSSRSRNRPGTRRIRTPRTSTRSYASSAGQARRSSPRCSVTSRRIRTRRSRPGRSSSTTRSPASTRSSTSSTSCSRSP